MISYLKGSVLAKTSDSIILQANNVGYKVFLAKKTLEALEVGAETEFFCSLQIKRDETLELFGVGSLPSLQVFELVRGISGIGPRAAMNIASLGDPDQLKKALEEGDETFFQGIHGLGPKKIKKILLELTGKLKIPEPKEEPKDKELVDAMVALGFPRTKAKDALSRVGSEIVNQQQRLREALKLVRR
ncbi:MAG: hypothetical protein A3A27_02955 [Candidatus Wildermuthbacteria bacterium RIFCSPLOWO2_01_FULL_47_18]|uniref:Holliday junction branch migration complex subunit RuvA n=2 Tax=Candidatus Wildermuthiibacteriota TaxID=1817923 RepID=A0A1G2RIV2_9BACT|nr:MAG: hypothetical protein A3J68_00690 [Candidatus Wildermuthbacteria bacterium RIFCSPHIGHO2_02_FULL_48_16]OHA71971.1 MAG: hypothetical protein A3A27_02955 [Candidatus Wildermuthbacteria bacterium RIFCSPLOWO2_01_FULL_47_18]